jgi:flagellar biogenesis protein FliO
MIGFEKTNNRPHPFKKGLTLAVLLPALNAHALSGGVPTEKTIQNIRSIPSTNSALTGGEKPTPTTSGHKTSKSMEATSAQGQVTTSSTPAVPPIPAPENNASSEGTSKSSSTAPETPLNTSQTPSNLVAPLPNGPATDLNPLNPSESALSTTTSSTESATGTLLNDQGKQAIETTAPANSASQTSENMVIPNGAALQSQLLPLNQNEGSPWSTLTAGAFLLLGLAAAGLMLVRLKNGRSLGLAKTEKQLQLLSALSLSPKRQIVLLRIRDKEVAIASTEHGITLLTEMEGGSRHSEQAPNDGGIEKGQRGRSSQPLLTMDSPQLVAAGRNTDSTSEPTVARSELLMGALKNIREKTSRARTNSNAMNTNPESRDERDSSGSSPKNASGLTRKESAPSSNPAETRLASEGSIKQTRANFPKYLANAFEQESRRGPQQPASNDASQDESSNVTNMIRERLKELRPLS